MIREAKYTQSGDIMNVNFICQRIHIDQLLKCSFALNASEMLVLKLMAKKEGECDISQLSKKLKKDRTTIQRAVKNLAEKGLIKRRQINLGNGGYYFVYAAIPKQVIKDMVANNLDDFKETVQKELDMW